MDDDVYQLDDRARVKALFEFLREYSLLRYKTVKNISKCEFVLPFPPPQAEGCPSVLASFGDDSDAGDVLLEVTKPAYRSCPRPAASFKAWLQDGWADHRKDVSLAFPDERTADRYSGVGVEEAFRSNAARVRDFEEWNSRRSDWVAAQRKNDEAQELFDRLFNMRTDLERSSETLELVAASMILTSPEDKELDYPLVSKRVKTVFDRERNAISVVDADDSPRLYGELLNSIPGLNYAGIREAEAELVNGDCHPFDADSVVPIVRRLVNSLTSHGQFMTLLEQGVDPHASLVVKEGYLLMLRNRPSGAARAITRILAALDDGCPLPSHLVALAGGGSRELPMSDEAPQTIEERLADINGESRDILLAKPANREQLEIARRIGQADAVLVQGPPGTGKTHTIANLMGHFLSEGKSVLVSSYTSKALSVLKDKLPPEMQGLCVSAIDGATADMERSIDSIVEHQSLLSIPGLARQIGELRDTRERIISELAEVRKALLDDLRGEYDSIDFQGEKIEPLDAARFVGENIGTFDGALPGSVTLGAPFPLTDAELSELYRSCVTVSREVEVFLDSLGDADSLDLVSAEEFSEILDARREAREAVDLLCAKNGWSYAEKGKSIELETPLGSISYSLRFPAQPLEEARAWIGRCALTEEWELGAAADGLRGQETAALWGRLGDVVRKTDSLAEKCRTKTFGHEVTLPDASDAQTLEHALRVRKERHGRGRLASLLGSLFGAGDDSAADTVLVDGHVPQTDGDCDLALLTVRLAGARRECALCWNQLIAANGGPSFASLDPVQSEHAAARYLPAMESAVAWMTGVTQGLALSLSSAGLDAGQLLSVDPLMTESAQVKELSLRVAGPLTDLLDLLLAWRGQAEGRLRLAELESGLCRCNGEGNAIVEDALSAVRAEDAAAYARAVERAGVTLEDKGAYLRRRELLDKVDAVAPRWAHAVRTRAPGHEGPDVPAGIKGAWRCKQYAAALAALHPASATDLQRRALELSREYRRVTSELAVDCAWLHLLERTQRNVSLNQALNGWKQTMKRIGKGKGRRAPELKAQARRLMTDCQHAVPGWIMPMDDALSAFDLLTTHFDVLIVDEASQADITSLALTVLADKLIVVGDDKQVSPMAVGVDLDAAKGGVDSRIRGIIPNAHLYGPRTSLYDLAATTFQPLMLKEHFRCMPDIIGYCNMTSYDNKIRPLRDQGSSALLPSVVEYYVEGGLRSQNGKTNKAEARKTVDIICACLDQPEYHNKTFGVISLLGPEQAVLVQGELLKTLGPAVITEHKILCGDAANFQGDERDVVILNLVDSNEGDGPIRLRSEGPDDAIKKRYNVAVSRAKDQLWVVHSLDPARDLKAGDLRRGLIEYARSPQEIANLIRSARSQVESPFEAEVAKALAARHYPIQQQFPVGSYRIDIAIIEGERRIAVECDGERWHSGEQKLLEDLERQTVLERLGWRFIRIRGSRYYADKMATLEGVFSQLEALGVEPRPVEAAGEGSSELLKRVLSAMGGWEATEDEDGRAGSDDGVADLQGTKLRDVTIAAALNDRSFEREREKPVSKTASPSMRNPAPERMASVPVTKPQQSRTTMESAGEPRFSRKSPKKQYYAAASLSYSPLSSSVEYGKGQNRRLAESRMEKVIESEAPIEVNELFRKVLESFGVKRAGVDVKNRNNEILKGIKCQKTLFQGHEYVWREEDVPREHCGFRVGGLRDIDGFAPEELIAAMRYTLKDKRRGVEGAELIRTTSRDLGYKRTGGKIEETLRAALDLACKDGAIVCGFGYYRLPDGQK